MPRGMTMSESSTSISASRRSTDRALGPSGAVSTSQPSLEEVYLQVVGNRGMAL